MEKKNGELAKMTVHRLVEHLLALTSEENLQHTSTAALREEFARAMVETKTKLKKVVEETRRESQSKSTSKPPAKRRVSNPSSRLYPGPNKLPTLQKTPPKTAQKKNDVKTRTRARDEKRVEHDKFPSVKPRVSAYSAYNLPPSRDTETPESVDEDLMTQLAEQSGENRHLNRQRKKKTSNNNNQTQERKNYDPSLEEVANRRASGLGLVSKTRNNPRRPSSKATTTEQREKSRISSNPRVKNTVSASESARVKSSSSERKQTKNDKVEKQKQQIQILRKERLRIKSRESQASQQSLELEVQHHDTEGEKEEEMEEEVYGSEFEDDEEEDAQASEHPEEEEEEGEDDGNGEPEEEADKEPEESETEDNSNTEDSKDQDEEEDEEDYYDDESFSALSPNSPTSAQPERTKQPEESMDKNSLLAEFDDVDFGGAPM